MLVAVLSPFLSPFLSRLRPQVPFEGGQHPRRACRAMLSSLSSSIRLHPNSIHHKCQGTIVLPLERRQTRPSHLDPGLPTRGEGGGLHIRTLPGALSLQIPVLCRPAFAEGAVGYGAGAGAPDDAGPPLAPLLPWKDPIGVPSPRGNALGVFDSTKRIVPSSMTLKSL